MPVTVETGKIFDPAEVEIWIEAIKARSVSMNEPIENSYAYYLQTNTQNQPAAIPNIQEAGKRLGIGDAKRSPIVTIIAAAGIAAIGYYLLTR